MERPPHLLEVAELASRLHRKSIAVHDVEWHDGAWLFIVAKNGSHLEVGWDADGADALSISRLLRGKGTGVEYWDKPEFISVPGGSADAELLVQRAEREIIARLPNA